MWFALVPLLLVVREVSPWRRWWAGFVFGFVWRLISLYWIGHVMVLYGGMSVPVGAAITGLLAVWMALNTGFFCLLVPYAWRRGAWGAALLAAAWISLEYLQTLLPFGFPWSLLGYAAGRSLLLMQGADLAGVWGLGFVAVFVNVAIAQRIVGRRRALTAATIAAGLVVSLALYGALRLAGAPAVGDAPADAGGEPLRVATVQGNVEQGRIWVPEQLRTILDDHLRLSRQAVAADADLIMWSESSVPVRGGLQGEATTRALLAQFARTHRVSMVVGSPYYDSDEGDSWVTNASFLLGADGEWAMRYDKVRLVPWGEYVPLDWLFRFVTPLVEAIAGFRPGAVDQPLFADRGAGVPPFGMVICYEVVFPDLVRRQAMRGAEFLATITNDAWFGDTFAPRQHFSMARLRAVENRRYLVRAANTGISGVVDPWGRVLTMSALDEQAMLTATIHPRGELTPYARWGDVLPRLCVLFNVGALLHALWLRRRLHSPTRADSGARKARP